MVLMSQPVVKDLFDTSQPIKGEKFLRVPYAIVLSYDGESFSKQPNGGFILKSRAERQLAKDGITVLKDTVWAIERVMTTITERVPYRYWQYSTQHPQIPPIEFDRTEVILVNEHGEVLK